MRKSLARLTSLALAAGCWLASPPAVADSAADKAAADALFEQGRALGEAGRYAEACPKYEESQRLDPGLGTALNLADCYERTDRLASSWGLFNETARAAEKRGDTKRAAEAARRAAILGPELAKLAIVVPPATRVPGLEVRKDGAVVGEGQWGSALPVDAGQHTIEASAPAHKAWSQVVRIETNGSSASVEIPALAALAESKVSSEAPAPFWNTQRTVGAAVGGAGLAFAIVGAVAGAITLSKAGDAKAYCSATMPYCLPQGIAYENSAWTWAHISDVGLAVGGAAVIAGLVTFFTAPSTAPPGATPPTSGRVRIGPLLGQGRAGIAAEGSW